MYSANSVTPVDSVKTSEVPAFPSSALCSPPCEISASADFCGLTELLRLGLLGRGLHRLGLEFGLGGFFLGGRLGLGDGTRREEEVGLEDGCADGVERDLQFVHVLVHADGFDV